MAAVEYNGEPDSAVVDSDERENRDSPLRRSVVGSYKSRAGWRSRLSSVVIIHPKLKIPCCAFVPSPALVIPTVHSGSVPLHCCPGGDTGN